MNRRIQQLLGALRIAAVAAVGGGAMVVLMIWLAGGWVDKVLPGGPEPLPERPIPPTVTVEAVRVPVLIEAVGSIQAAHEIALSSRLPGPAEVVQISASPGRLVTAGDVLVRLRDDEYRTRAQQASAALEQARFEYDRIMKLNESGRAAASEVAGATNNLEMARGKLKEAEALLGYTVIRAPDRGVVSATTQAEQGTPQSQPDAAPPASWIVINKYAEVGDTVQPGQVLIRLYDRPLLIATVPESMRQHLEVGQMVNVHIDAIDKSCLGQVSEIVPQAHQVSRTFQVKVTGPCQPGILVGMFARMRTPSGQERTELRVPRTAVRRVGQVTTVFVVRDNRLARQFVELGRTVGEQVVVTSGLAAGDRVVGDAAGVPLSDAE